MTEPSEFKYDVALSFLADDEAVAQSITDALRQTCSVFMYSERQRELAGRDGADEFTAVFRDQARVCVVLYRDGWGGTKWTRVEETAIKDRAFDSGWEFLTVVALTPGAPIWLPKTKLWLGFERFGVQGAVAVIEARVREQGGEVVVESARSRADRLTRLAQARAERDSFLNSPSGVAAAKDELTVLRNYVKNEADAMRRLSPPIDVVVDEAQQGDVFSVSMPRAGLTFGWSLQYSNTLHHSNMLIQEFNRPYRVGAYTSRRHEPVHRETWLFTRTLEGGAGWYEEGSPDQVLSSTGVAERFLKRLLDRTHEERPASFDEW